MFSTTRSIFKAVMCLSAFCLYLDAEELPEGFNIFVPEANWTFISGAEFPPGGLGYFTLKAISEVPAAGVLNFDFTQGGEYVGAETKVDISQGYQELRLRVKSDRRLTLGIRLKDSSEQIHQWRIIYSNHGEWQPMRVRLDKTAPTHFGGAKDGVIHYPVKSIQLLVNHRGIDEPGQVAFTEFEVQ